MNDSKFRDFPPPPGYKRFRSIISRRNRTRRLEIYQLYTRIRFRQNVPYPFPVQTDIIFYFSVEISFTVAQMTINRFQKHHTS